ncbi:putative short chain dehydrogenase/reductase [Trypanosoma conorhini]|uniref:Putative short chain dehydrogenase/reductase n=1 Tax=Trypanosoma conorhini TaxID=83891 RepID=A0A3R7LBE0_9TRYP|nr:putative short chain dehydrogenase/reductase [Trypanosoma conorhini]RNF20041.1 putative short chain dehydrogenase/reductase [Trypanosoma conorhini]
MASYASGLCVRRCAVAGGPLAPRHGWGSVRHYQQHTMRLLRPRKLSQAKQQPLFPGMCRRVKRFEGEHTYNYGYHTYAILRESSTFLVLPGGFLAVYVATFFVAFPFQLQVMYSLLLFAFSRYIARGRRNREWKDLSDRHVIVTGGTSGIGRETASQLASMGADVTVLSRDGPHVEAAMAYIKRSAKSEAQQIRFTALDLTDFIAIRDYCKRAQHQRMLVDILVDNAGLMQQQQVMSRFGDDEQLAVNLLGPFLLTEGLLPLVAENGGRVVYVSCSAHVAVKGNIVSTYLSGRGLWSPRVRDRFDGLEQYGFTKLGCIYHAQDLAVRSYANAAKPLASTVPATATFATAAANKSDNNGPQKNDANDGGGNTPRYTTCVAVPGGVVTNLYRHVPLATTFRWCRYLYLLFMRTAREGSQVVVNCCVREELVNGGYYQNCRYSPSGLSAAACNVDERQSVLAWVRRKMQPYMRWER